MFAEFGRRGGKRLLGRGWQGRSFIVDRSHQAAQKAHRLVDQGKVPAVVEYKTPSVRANETAVRSVKSGVAALGVAALPILIAFLTVGDFGRTAIITLITGLGIAVLMVALNWAQKSQEARADDAPLDDPTRP